jgi:ribulose-phosphate 3-epimerase
VGKPVRTLRIAPSVLSCDLARVADEVADIERAGADLVHFDVMDGVFVPNLTFGAGLCEAVRRVTELPLDVHLMVAAPEKLLEAFVRAGARRVAVHLEAVTHLHRVLAHLRDLGVSPGVAVNPLTPVGALEEVWPFVDYVLVMTVNPGFGGQHLIPEMLDKLARLDAVRTRAWPDVELAVDGGVDESNAAALRERGADVLVAGTAIFEAADRRRAVRALRGEEGE